VIEGGKAARAMDDDPATLARIGASRGRGARGQTPRGDAAWSRPLPAGGTRLEG
jgi:hypothetical protein